MVFVMSQLAKQCGRHIGGAHGESANRMPKRLGLQGVRNEVNENRSINV